MSYVAKVQQTYPTYEYSTVTLAQERSFKDKNSIIEFLVQLPKKEKEAILRAVPQKKDEINLIMRGLLQAEKKSDLENHLQYLVPEAFQAVSHFLTKSTPPLVYQGLAQHVNPLKSNTIFTKVDFLLHHPLAADTRIARPLKEIWSHIKHAKLPSLSLIVRAIKVLALGIFRGHLCDRIMLQKGQTLICNFKGKLTYMDHSAFQTRYRYLLENSFLLQLKQPAEEKAGFPPVKSIRAQNVVEYYKNSCAVQVTHKEKGNHVRDLLISKAFDRKSFPAA